MLKSIARYEVTCEDFFGEQTGWKGALKYVYRGLKKIDEWDFTPINGKATSKQIAQLIAEEDVLSLTVMAFGGEMAVNRKDGEDGYSRNPEAGRKTKEILASDVAKLASCYNEMVRCAERLGKIGSTAFETWQLDSLKRTLEFSVVALENLKDADGKQVLEFEEEQEPVEQN